MEKMIIVAAIDGGAAGTPSMSPYLPITPKQIIDEAIACAEAGANIVHFHVFNPHTGQQIGDIELYKEISSAVKKRSNVVLKPSTGGGDMEARCETVRVLKPEMVAIVPGSQNIVLAPMAEEVKEWKFDWEKPYLEDTWGLGNVQQNSFEELWVWQRSVPRAKPTRVSRSVTFPK